MSETPRTPDDEGTAQLPVQPARDAPVAPAADAPAQPADVPAQPAPAQPAALPTHTSAAGAPALDQQARQPDGSSAPANPGPATPGPPATATAGLPPRRPTAVWVVVAAVVGGVMLLGLAFAAGFGTGYVVGDRTDGGWSRFEDRMGPGMMDEWDDRGRNGEMPFPRDDDSRGRNLPDSQDDTSGS